MLCYTSLMRITGFGSETLNAEGGDSFGPQLIANVFGLLQIAILLHFQVVFHMMEQ